MIHSWYNDIIIIINIHAVVHNILQSRRSGDQKIVIFVANRNRPWYTRALFKQSSDETIATVLIGIIILYT